MAIGVSQFSPQPDYGNLYPEITGALQNALAARGQIQKQAIQPQMLQAQLQNAVANQKMANLKLQSAPALQQALLAQAQQKVPLLKAQTFQAQQTGKYMPETLNLRAMNVAAALQRAHAYQQNAAIRGSQTEAGKSLQATNKNYTKSVLKGIANFQNTVQHGTPLEKNSGVQQQQPQNPNQEIPITDNDIKSAQNLGKSNVLSKELTPQQRQQMVYENSANHQLNNIQRQLPLYTEYTGLSGRARLASETAAVALGAKASPSYIAYNNLINVNGPLASQDIRRAFGSQATDSETRVMNNLVRPKFWKSNPRVALQQLLELRASLKANAMAITQTYPQTLAQEKTIAATPIKGLASSSLSGNKKVDSTFKAQSFLSPIRVKSPTGQSGSIPASQLKEALASGYTRI